MDSPTAKDPLALPVGSLILVTGSSGFIGSHVACEALLFGYRVRGAVRSEAKAKLVTDHFDNPNFSAHVIADLTDEDALASLVRNCVGIIHVASNTTLSPDPKVVIAPTVAIATSILKAAQRSGTCRRFVYTSSASAVCIPPPNTPMRLDASMWNDVSVAKARSYTQAPFPPDAFYHVYAASKTLAEQAVWEFVADEKPSFTVNTIIPNTNIGCILLKAQPPTSSANFALAVLKGRLNFGTNASWMIDVSDDAKIHLGALIDGTVSNQRVFAYAHRFHWNDLLEAVKEARPDATTPPEPLDDGLEDLTEVDNGAALGLLKKWWKQDGFRSFEDSVRENLEGFG